MRTLVQASKLLEGFREEHKAKLGIEENGREVKIVADRIIHESLVVGLEATGLPILSEEGSTPDAFSGWSWIIDPLDGSVNYQRGISLYSISIALCHDRIPKYGLLYDGSGKRIIHGGKGRPGTPLRCSQVENMDQTVLCTGIPSRMTLNEKATGEYRKMFENFHKVRMFGSASQSLLHLAEGKADAYFERNIMNWDIAAGLALLDAAGGKWKAQPGSRRNSLVVLAATPSIFDDCYALLMENE